MNNIRYDYLDTSIEFSYCNKCKEYCYHTEGNCDECRPKNNYCLDDVLNEIQKEFSYEQKRSN